MTHEQIAKAFNEWMRRYTEEPETFEAEYTTVKKFLEEGGAKTATYGETQAAYLEFLVKDMGL